MNYLGICTQVNGNAKDGFVGKVSPKACTNWNKISPFILSVEGVHQFCVRAVKIAYLLQKNILHIPVQLRDVKIENGFSYDDFEITGNVTRSATLFRVDFSVNEDQVSVSGVVIVSSVKGSGK